MPLNNFVKQIGKVKKIISDTNYPIWLMSTDLLYIIKRATANYKKLTIKDVQIIKDDIVIFADYNTYNFRVPITLFLKPSGAKKRQLYFDIVNVKPFYLKYFKRKSNLIQSDFVNVEGDRISIKLDQFSVAQNIKYGNIKETLIEDDKLKVVVQL